MSDGQKSIHQLVLLRGLAREARHWGSFVDDLKAAYEALGQTVRIETIDLPGCGRHSEMMAEVSMAANAEFVRQRFKDILVREVEEGLRPADHRRLVAISLGGMVGAAWLELYPHDFHSSVLINSSFRGLSKFYERLRWNSWWRLGQIVGSREVEERERQVLDWISNRKDKRAEVLERWIAIQHSRPVSRVNLALQLSAAVRFSAPETWPVPLLVLLSESDRMVDPSCSEEIGRHYAADIFRHPTAGHDLTLDEGPWAAKTIAEWKIKK